LRQGGGTAPNSRLLVAVVATIAFKVDVLHHFVGSVFNLKLQGLEVLRGISTSLDLGHINVRIVRLNSHQHTVAAAKPVALSKVNNLLGVYTR
jgi:hypothetical protein